MTIDLTQRWQVIQGDGLAGLSTLTASCVDLVVVDAPYSSGGMVRGDRMMGTREKYQQSDVQAEHESFPGDNRDQRSWMIWCSLWLGECLRVSNPGSMLCAFTDWRQLPQLTDAIQCAGWVYRGIVPWNKVVARPVANRFRAQCEYIVWGTNGPRDSSPTPSSTYLPGFFEVRTVPTDDREHATQKPVELMRELVKLCPAGGTILDPMTGSGSTGVAAVSLGYRFLGFEISEYWASVARRRITESANTLWTPTPVSSDAGKHTP